MNPDSSSPPAVQRLRERLRQTTAQEILDAAERVFGERGIHATAMSDIAAAAGVAVGTLYNHYKDRDTLVSTLVAQRRSELLLRIDTCLGRTDGQPFRTQLEELLREIFTHCDAHWQLFVTFTQTELGPPGMSQPGQAIVRELYQRFALLVARGRKQRALRAKFAELAPALLMGLTRSMLVRRTLVPEEGSMLQHVKTLVDFVLQGAGSKGA